MDLNTVEAVLTGPAALDRAGWDEGDAFLAGGSWLFSEPQVGLRRLHDLTGLGWEPLTTRADGLEIAATCTLATLAAFVVPAPWSAARALVRPCYEALLGSFKVWNVATVGGNVCLGLPAGPMTSLTAALDGAATVIAPDETSRTVPVTRLVRGPRNPALAPGEVVRSIQLPVGALTGRAVMRRLSLYDLGRSAVLVIGRLDRDGTCVVTVTASTLHPVQLRFVGVPSPAEALAALADARPPWYDDVHGAPAWRRFHTERFVREIVAELAEPA